MKKYLVVEEVAEQLRCSKRTVQSLVAAGTIPAIRLPGTRRLLFDPDAIEDTLARSDAAVR